MTPDDLQPPAASVGRPLMVDRMGECRARSFAIASGKGGVGKTWFAISLAATLSCSGSRVLLVDGDLGLANVDVQLGLLPQRDLGDVIEEGCGIGGAVIRCEPGRFDVLAGRAGSGALSSLPAASLERLLLELGGCRTYDVILFDLGAGIDRSVRRMACWADTLLVIATDEPTSLTDAYVVLKVHAGDKRRLALGSDECPPPDARIIVNQATTHLAGQQTYDTLARVSATYLRFTPTLAGIVRRDDRVRDAIRGQACFPLRYPTAPAALDLEQVARSLRARSSAD